MHASNDISFSESSTKWILGGLLLVFTSAKIMHLNVPLFHDELGVYGQGLFYLLDNGPSMMPGDMIPVLSRGHPLFFVFITSLCTQLLGGSLMAAKCIILCFSLALIAATYHLGKALFDVKTGLAAAFLLSFQAVFFAQSTLVLPEVLLALLAVLSLLFYHQQKYLLYWIAASCMILTKETGLVLFGGIGLHIWYLNQFKINGRLIGQALKWMAPIATFILFLVVQKIQNGWFLYPYHTGLISFDPNDIVNRFALGLKHLFYDQGRVFVLLTCLFILLGKKIKLSSGERSVYVLIASFLMVFFAFSSLNYFMARYQLMVLPTLMIAIAACWVRFQTKVRSSILVLLGLFVSLPYQYSTTTFSTDENMNYLITVENMQKSIAALDSISDNRAVKVFALFPEIWALLDPRHGYTNNPNYQLYDRYNDSCTYIIRGSNNIFDEDAAVFGKIDSILFDKEKLQQSNFEQLYEHQLYFSKQAIFKNNAAKL